MKKLSLLLGIVLLISCEADELTATEKSLVGTWRLAEFCVSPGTGECTLQPASAIQTQTLEFRKDGSFIERIPERQKFWTPVVSSGQYTVLEENSRIQFRFDVSSSTVPADWGYQLSGKRMTLLPTCFEGCKYTYEKIK
ncbi:hypothetical protein [Telluribacter sp.]|jgi:hypothetical protein|uniref:hypothetical protein n=1 Tax=Telluribacter sp. TaxID=1978767 RepID=UPI002E0FECD1|nr:hypothetical protein [Telluribacter sp.]